MPRRQPQRSLSAVNVNAPADRFQFHEDSSELADVLFRLLHHRVCWRSFAVCRWVAGSRRQAGVRACRGRH